MIVSRAGLAAMDIADGIMVSRYQAHEFAWLALSEATLGRMLNVCIAFLIGGLALVPRHFARGDQAGARQIWLRTFPFALGLGLLGILMGWYGTPILTLLGQKQDLSAGAGPVMLISSLGNIPALLAIGAAVYLEGINRPQFVAVSVTLANFLNIALNWVFISGHLGFAALGARGSAWSTTFVRLALAVALVSYAWRWYREKSPMESEAEVAERAASRRAQWRLGAGSAITVLAMVTLTSPLTLIAGVLGVLPLASFSAALDLAGLAGLVALGMSDAAGIYVAAEAARDGLRAAAKVAWASVGVALVPMAIAAASLAIWASFFAGLYTSDIKMRTPLAAALPFIGVIVLIDCVAFVTVASLRALRETAWATGIEITSLFLLLPLAFTLALKEGFGIRGLFIAMLVTAMVRAIAIAYRFWWRTRVDDPA